MVFKDINFSIHLCFIENYYKFPVNNWFDFIVYKDLGIICLSWQNHLYKIVDEKKWVLAKIKYGI
jgi:hypothetical protein